MPYDDTNRGVLFSNRNRKSENHPNLTGKLNIDGVEYYLSAWTKTSKAGEKYISLSLGKPVEAAKTESRREPTEPPPQEFEDEIPF